MSQKNDDQGQQLARDMKKTIKSPADLAEKYGAYEGIARKAFKKLDELKGTKFMFLADFQLDTEEIVPILFLGELNSLWKQAIRKDYKRRTTFAYGICDLGGENPEKPILILKYQGGKGAKPKNVRAFKRAPMVKKYFEDVVFEKLTGEEEVLDLTDNTVSSDQDSTTQSTTDKKELFVEVLKGFGVLQQDVNAFKENKSEELKDSIETELAAVNNLIADWEKQDKKAPKEQVRIDKIKEYNNKLLQLLGKYNPTDLSNQLPSNQSSISIELINIESFMADLNAQPTDASGLQERFLLSEAIQQNISAWRQKYSDGDDIYKKELTQIDQYARELNQSTATTLKQEHIVDFKELIKDFKDLQGRVSAYKAKHEEKEDYKPEKLKLYLQEVYILNAQFENWKDNNKEFASSDIDSRVTAAYEKYMTPTKGYLPKLKQHLEELLSPLLGNQPDQETKSLDEIIIKEATGYTLEEVQKIKSLGTLDKNLLKGIKDKSLKTTLEKLTKKLKKVEPTNAEEKRFTLWQIQITAEKAKSNNNSQDHSKLDAILKATKENIKGLAKIESDNDVYEDFIAAYQQFLNLKTQLEGVTELATYEKKKNSIIAKKAAIEKEKDDKEKKKLQIEVDQLEQEADQLAQVINNDFDKIAQIFDDIEGVLTKINNLLAEWDAKYRLSQHYDTVTRGNELRQKRQEVFDFFLKERVQFHNNLERDDNFDKNIKALKERVASYLKYYNEKDNTYAHLLHKHQLYQNELQDRGENQVLLDQNKHKHLNTHHRDLVKVQLKTQTWLFEAKNIYHPSDELTKRIKILEDYLKRFEIFLKYRSYKEEHYELKQQEKEAIHLLQKYKKSKQFVDNKVQELKSTSDFKGTANQALLDMVYEITEDKEAYLSTTQLNKYKRQYEEEVLHYKYAKDLHAPNPVGKDGEIKDKDYLLGLFEYMANNIERTEVQKIQNTLSRMEQNYKNYQQTQKEFFKNEVSRLAEVANHPIEKALLEVIKKIDAEFKKKIQTKEQKEQQVDTLQEEINQLKIKKSADGLSKEEQQKLTDLGVELQTKKKDVQDFLEVLKTDQSTINIFYDAFTDVMNKGVKIHGIIRQALSKLKTSGIDTSKEAKVFFAALPKKEDGKDLNSVFSTLNAYFTSHKTSFRALLEYDLEDISHKANQKIIKNFFDNKETTYRVELDKIKHQKTELYTAIKDKVSEQKVADLQALGKDAIQKILADITAWDNIVIPIIGSGSKELVQQLEQQKLALQKYKGRLEIALATLGNVDTDHHLKDIHAYYEQIAAIGKKFDAPLEDLAKSSLPTTIDQEDVLFNYCKENLYDTIQTVYEKEGISPELFCDNMYWSNTIKRTAKKIQKFKNYLLSNRSPKEALSDWKAEKIDLIDTADNQPPKNLKTGFSTKSIKTEFEDHLNQLEQKITDDPSSTNFLSLKAIELDPFWEEIEGKLIQAELDAILEADKAEGNQATLKEALFIYRGVSGNVDSLQLEKIQPENLQKQIKLICNRAHRLLELGFTNEAQLMVRNIPGTFLTNEFVAAKRILEDVDQIFQGKNMPIEGTTSQENLTTGGISTLAEGLETPQLDEFLKLSVEDQKMVEQWGDYLEAGDFSMAYDKETGGFSIELGENPSEEAEAYLNKNKDRLLARAAKGHKLAGVQAVLATVATGLNMGLEAKGILDLLTNYNELQKNPDDAINLARYAKMVQLNVLASITSWTQQGIDTFGTFKDMAAGELWDEFLEDSTDHVGNIAKASLLLVKTLGTFAAGEVGAKIDRKTFVRTTVSNTLDLGIGIVDILDVFDPPGIKLVGDVLKIAQDIKTTLEAQMAYRVAKQKAHHMKLLSEHANNIGSDYQAALKGIRKDTKRQRQQEGVNLTSAGVDLGLDSVKLVGDLISLSPEPVGQSISTGIGIGVKILKAIKTGSLLSYEAYLEYKKSNRHKEIKNLLTRIKSNDLDAIALIQSKSVHYAKAFLIEGVLQNVKEGNDKKQVQLKTDSAAYSYIEQTGLDINAGTAQEIIEAHVGSLDMGMFTHRFEKYYNTYKDFDTNTKLSAFKANNLAGSLKALQTTLNELKQDLAKTFKNFNDLQVFKTAHPNIAFASKHTKLFETLELTNQLQKSILQAVDVQLKKEIVPNFSRQLDQLDLSNPQTFDQYKGLNAMRKELEQISLHIPHKALLKS